MKKVKIKTFFKKNIDKSQYKIVLNLAKEIEKFINIGEVNSRIQKANSKGSHSKEIQDIIMEFASPLGFVDEKEGLFKKYKNSKLRPDFFMKLDKGGILMEVEKGKTITNNMDLLDLWKCHICEEANHLFLLVPIEVTHTKNIFNSVCNRMNSFFQIENYLNIDSVTVFGY
jgi:hypothetical protein